MSADNWTVCPICEDKRLAEIEAERERVSAAYGSVPVDEFDQMRADLEKSVADTPPETWREDWEIGLFSGELFIDYRGACSACKAERKFRHSEIVSAEGVTP